MAIALTSLQVIAIGLLLSMLSKITFDILEILEIFKAAATPFST